MRAAIWRVWARRDAVNLLVKFVAPQLCPVRCRQIGFAAFGPQ
jgi:hypothetical protein